MNVSEPGTRNLESYQWRAIIAGAVALVACVLGALVSPQQFFRSYLVGYVFWTGMALGCLSIAMLHQLVGGGWGMAIRRLLDSGARTLPLMLVFVLPLLLGLPHLYAWARPADVAADHLLQHKSLYLNVPFFLIRTALYFAIWLALAYYVSRPNSQRKLGGPGLVLYCLTVSFAAFDWVMSLEAEWFSTIFGVIFIFGQALTAMAFVIAVLFWLTRRTPLAGVLNPQQFHDLGNLMLAFVMLWAYVAFSQFLIIWSGNLPEEVTWYIARLNGGWGWIAGLLVVFHFVAPFLVLLSRQNKRRLPRLALLAGVFVFIRLLDLFWMVIPAFHPKQFAIHWMDLLATAGIGGIWLGVFVWQLRKGPLVPEPALEGI
jgi:hypothetical protein